jgi:hypothetical protein
LRRRRHSRVVLTVVVVVAVAVVTHTAGARHVAPRHATLGTFARYWTGHTRDLRIGSGGRAIERINGGCCVVDVHYTFRLLRPPRGTVRDASVAFRVTAVRVWRIRGRPRVGRRGELRLRRGVITDSLTHATFCAPYVDKCGA